MRQDWVSDLHFKGGIIMCCTVEKWLMGIFCQGVPGVRSPNIYQKLFSSFCRHVSTQEICPCFSATSSLVRSEYFGFSVRCDAQQNKACLAHV